jgi:hypothetical protein
MTTLAPLLKYATDKPRFSSLEAYLDLCVKLPFWRKTSEV